MLQFDPTSYSEIWLKSLRNRDMGNRGQRLQGPSAVTLFAASPTPNPDMGATTVLCLAFFSHPYAWCEHVGTGRFCQQASSLVSHPFVVKNPEQSRIVKWYSSVPHSSQLISLQRNQSFLPQRLQDMYLSLCTPAPPLLGSQQLLSHSLTLFCCSVHSQPRSHPRSRALDTSL